MEDDFIPCAMKFDEASGPLGGLAFVVSGDFQNITRPKLEEFIKKSGGRLLGSVGAKTNILIVGKLLEDGRPVTEGGKFKKAMQLGKKVITEKEFELWCRRRFDDPDFTLGRRRNKEQNTTDGADDHFIDPHNPDLEASKDLSLIHI